MEKKILLLIEDDEFIRTLYTKQFDLNGFSTDVAATGNDGLAKVKTTKYDLILLDILLPDINGLEVLKKIKQEANLNQNTPVVLLTNIGQDSVIQEGFKLGAKSYLLKSSYSLEQIVKELKFILEQPN